MKIIRSLHQLCPYLIFVLIISSCRSHVEKPKEITIKKTTTDKPKLEYSAHDKVTSGILDQSGNLWFGTTNEGVFRYDGNSFVNFTENDGLSSNYINSIAEDKAGTIWFGSNNGLCKYDGMSFSQVIIPWKHNKNQGEDWWDSNIIQCLLLDKNDNLWVGTGGHGVYRYDGKSFYHYTFDNDMPQSDGLHHNYIQSMLEDSSGNIWFTSMTHGCVSRYDGKEFTHFSSSDGLQDDMICASFEDDTGKLWFGSIQTKYKGLYYFDGISFKGFGKEDGLCDNFVTGFFQDTNRNLWIRTGTILCIYDGETFSPFVTKEGKPLEDINLIVADESGDIWLGGRFGKLWKYDGNKLIDFTQKGR